MTCPGTATGTRGSIEQLVIAVRQLGIDDQVDTALKWTETPVQATDVGCGSTFTLAEWLNERRPDLTTSEQEAMWRRVLDTQVVAGNTEVSHLADWSSHPAVRGGRDGGGLHQTRVARPGSAAHHADDIRRTFGSPAMMCSSLWMILSSLVRL